MQDMQMQSAPVSEASLKKTPQELLKSSVADFTSVFGNATNIFLESVPILKTDENEETPFSYKTVVLNNVLGQAPVTPEYYVEDVEDKHLFGSSIKFEC